MTMEINFELKVGKIEVRFEGSEKVFESKIEPILKDLIQFGKASAAQNSALEVEHPAASSSGKTPLPAMTVKSVAVKLSSSSGSELLYAAVATLAILKRKETFTRQELND